MIRNGSFNGKKANLLARTFAVIVFLIAFPATLMCIIGISFSGSKIVGVLYLACSSLLTLAAIVTVITPKFVKAILPPLLLIIPVFSFEQWTVKKQHDELCDKLKNDFECVQSGHGFQCSQESKFKGGIIGISECKRDPVLEKKANQYQDKKIATQNAIAAENERMKRADPEFIRGKLAKTNGIDFFKPSEINTEHFQNILIESYPDLIRTLKDDFEFQESSLKTLARKVYKFSFFLPLNIQRKMNVKKIGEEFESIYLAEKEIFTAKLMEQIQAYKYTKLIHPEIMKNKDFLKIFIERCIQQNDQNPGSIYPDTAIPYFNQTGIFDEQDKKNFIAVHPQDQYAFTCYPKDMIDDEQVLLNLAAKQNYNNFIEDAYKYNKGTKLSTLYFDKDIESAKHIVLNSPEEINRISDETRNSKKFQSWLFDYTPQTLKLVGNIVFDEETLTSFIKKQYRPERFFSFSQKQNPTVKKLLLTYKNEDTESLKRSSRETTALLSKLQCCGTRYSREMKSILETLPEEILKQDSFHIQNSKSTIFPDHYMRILSTFRPISKGLKNHIINTCKTSTAYYSYFEPEDKTPTFVKEDKIFHDNLKTACKSHLKKFR